MVLYWVFGGVPTAAVSAVFSGDEIVSFSGLAEMCKVSCAFIFWGLDCGVEPFGVIVMTGSFLIASSSAAFLACIFSQPSIHFVLYCLTTAVLVLYSCFACDIALLLLFHCFSTTALPVLLYYCFTTAVPVIARQSLAHYFAEAWLCLRTIPVLRSELPLLFPFCSPLASL